MFIGGVVDMLMWQRRPVWSADVLSCQQLLNTPDTMNEWELFVLSLYSLIMSYVILWNLIQVKKTDVFIIVNGPVWSLFFFVLLTNICIAILSNVRVTTEIN